MSQKIGMAIIITIMMLAIIHDILEARPYRCSDYSVLRQAGGCGP